MTTDIDKEKWMTISISVSTTAGGLIDHKKVMKEYADELDWKMHADKEGHIDADGDKMYFVKIFPEGEKISPADFRRLKDKIYAFTDKIALLIPTNIDAEGNFTITTQFGPAMALLDTKKKEDFMMFISRAGILNIEYPLIKRVELEKENLNYAKGTFESDLNTEWNNYEGSKITLMENWFNKDIKELKKRRNNKLEDWFGIIID
jgi:hypothetical protein